MIEAMLPFLLVSRLCVIVASVIRGSSLQDDRDRTLRRWSYYALEDSLTYSTKINLKVEMYGIKNFK